MFQTDFTPDELRDRRQRLCESIGEEATILLQGAGVPGASTGFRQDNDMYYLCGVEIPRAYLVIAAGNARTTLFLPHEAQVGKQEDGEVLCAENAVHVREVTGVDQVQPLEALSGRLQHAGTVFTPFRAGQGAQTSDDNSAAWYRRVLADPWDGRLSRPSLLLGLLRERFPRVTVRDVSPLIADLRSIKSPAEIALLRRAGELTAIGVREAMRSTAPGVMEYQLDAVMRYHFLAGGARDRGYIAICASGDNIPHGHYCANRHPIDDWVLVDCAPDYRYYTSDIGRMWPLSGTYSDVQRSLYGYVVEYHKALLAEVRAGVTMEEVHSRAADRMRPVFEDWTFHSPVHREGCEALFDWRGHVSHAVGMCVHDGSHHRTGPMESGMVFSLDPSIIVRDAHLYVRIEDTVVVTDNGCENLTGAAPIELDDVEALMREDGLLQAFPEAFEASRA